jgi:hypothetical protein
VFASSIKVVSHAGFSDRQCPKQMTIAPQTNDKHGKMLFAFPNLNPSTQATEVTVARESQFKTFANLAALGHSVDL